MSMRRGAAVPHKNERTKTLNDVLRAGQARLYAPSQQPNAQLLALQAHLKEVQRAADACAKEQTGLLELLSQTQKEADDNLRKWKNATRGLLDNTKREEGRKIDLMKEELNRKRAEADELNAQNERLVKEIRALRARNEAGMLPPPSATWTPPQVREQVQKLVKQARASVARGVEARMVDAEARAARS